MLKSLWRRRLVLRITGLSTLSLSCVWMLWNMSVLFSIPKRTVILKIPNSHEDERDSLKVQHVQGVRNNGGNTLSKSTAFGEVPIVFPVYKTLLYGRISETRMTSNNLSSATHEKNSSSSTPRITKSAYKYFLSVIIMLRIYRDDKAKWTMKELKQWMHYMFYAGVEHIYLCDHYIYSHERLKPQLLKYIDKGLLTYLDWPWNASKNGGQIMTHQVKCYDHMFRTYGHHSRWQTTIDMDEFPFCAQDFKRGFLSRYLHKQEATDDHNEKNERDSVSMILMENFLMLGQGNRSKTMTIERINRITKKIANKLTKPIFKPKDLSDVGIHTHYLRVGKSVHANINELRMLHYWGARTQNWGPDTNETLEITQPFPNVAVFIAPMVRKSLISFEEFDAFSNSSGP